MPKKPIESERPVTEPKQELIKAKKPRKEPFGRPSIYTPELAERICDLIATHTDGIRELCLKYPELPDETTIHDWRWKNTHFSQLYARAKMHQAELMAEQIKQLSSEKRTYIDTEGNERIDSGAIASQRLQVDTIKWIACKLAPKIYGDKVTHEGNITINHEMALKELE